MYLSSAFAAIQRMNKTNGAPLNAIPTDLGIQRIQQFKKIIKEEISEVDGILDRNPTGTPMTLEDMVKLSDWLIDICVYCMSECGRWGIPASKVFENIMDSQVSKLDETGKPIICPDTKKFLKGPNYKPPEPNIRRSLLESFCMFLSEVGHVHCMTQEEVDSFKDIPLNNIHSMIRERMAKAAHKMEEKCVNPNSTEEALTTIAKLQQAADSLPEERTWRENFEGNPICTNCSTPLSRRLLKDLNSGKIPEASRCPECGSTVRKL